MYMYWLALGASPIVAFAVGHFLGHRNEAWYWRDHAGPLHRSAVCSDSQFYYVVPEREYVDLELDHIYLVKLKEDCGISRDD